jgi:hypothetical protein
LSESKIKQIQKNIHYFENHQPKMNYKKYHQKGYSIRYKSQLMDICYREGIHNATDATCMQKIMYEIKTIFGL